MKTLFAVFALLLSGLQVEGQIKWDGILDNLSKESVYLIGKASNTKESLISRKFNIKDNKISHVALGFFNNETMYVAHITDRNGKNDAYVIEEIQSFITSNEHSYYLSIWEYKCSEYKLNEFKKEILNYTANNLIFDYDFRLDNNSNQLYCSEFCRNLLYKIFPDIMNFQPLEIELDSVSNAYLNRSELIYYPVDFFQSKEIFKKVYELNY